MRINQWKVVPALVAGVTMLGGCQTNGPTRGPEPPQLVMAQSAVHAPGTCGRDLRRGPRNFLVTIHVGPPGTPLLKEGSKVIGPGEVPVFRVVGIGATPNGKLHIRFVGQEDAKGNPIVDDRGRHLVETPFVAGNDKVFRFEVDEKGNPQSGKSSATQEVRARTMCDQVCTYERPCKYSIVYESDKGEYPELDPYTIIH